MVITIIADVIHFLTIFIVCDMFFDFKRKQFEHKWLVLALTNIIVVGMCALVYMYNNHFIVTLLYILTVLLSLFVFYRETIKTIVVTTVWTMFALSMIDTMVDVLFDMLMKILEVNTDVLSYLPMTTISMVLICIVGTIYRKYTSTTLKKVGLKNLIGFTILLAIDTVVITIITVMNTLLKTLKIPTLIITDLDIQRTKDEKKSYKQISKLIGRETTNQTIIHYNVNRKDISNIPRYFQDDNIYITFQNKVGHYYMTSFEEAFVASNYNNEIVNEVLKKLNT